MNEKVLKHKEICDGLNELYARKNHDYSEFNLYCPFPAVHRLTLLSIPRVWDTSQQAIFNRRAAAQEGENTERVPLSYACYESFSLLPTTTESPVLPTLSKRKTLQSQKDYNAS